MSELRVDSVKSKGGGAPNLPKGVTISGIATAATLGATTVDVSNVNVSGVVTSATLNGPLLSTGTPTLGLGVTINSSGVAISGVATAGIVSATTLYGDGSNLSGVGATIAPLFYQPDPYDTGVLLDAGIGITFNQQVKAGTGNVTLSIANAGVAGTVVENFGVGSSVTISENRITIDPTADISVTQDYIISYPSGAFTNNEGTDYVGTAYTFQARAYQYQLWAWGGNAYGMTKPGVPGASVSSPIQIPGTTWSVTAGGGGNLKSAAQFTGFIKTDNTLWMWGANEWGGLGQNGPGNVHYSSPIQIPGSWASYRAGRICVLATKTDGTFWGWGQNSHGKLGQNQAYPALNGASSPVQIPGTDWASGEFSIDTGSQFNGAIKTDGTLWVMGHNEYGNLGQNSTTYYSSPVQIPGTTWSKLGFFASGATAIKTDGTMWAWGYNQYGQLGQNNRTNYSSPVQIPGTDWSMTRGGGGNVKAIKTDGTLWIWGQGSYGSMGLNLPDADSKRSSPTQIPGSWSDVGNSGGDDLNSSFGVKTDGTLWSWGYNQAGVNGINIGSYPGRRSSPTQIGSDTDWYGLSDGHKNNMYAWKRI